MWWKIAEELKIFLIGQILPLTSQYIFSLLVFVNKNRGLFLSNSEIHDINTTTTYICLLQI